MTDRPYRRLKISGQPAGLMLVLAWVFSAFYLPMLGCTLLRSELKPPIKSPALAIKLLVQPQVSGMCLASLTGPPSQEGRCLDWIGNVNATASYDPSRRLIFMGAGDSWLHVLDADTGRPFAQIKTEGRVTTKTLFSRDGMHIYFGTDKGAFSCHDAFSFAKIFSFQVDGTLNNDLIFVNDNIVFSTGLATVYSINRLSGQEQWRLARPLTTNRLTLASNSNIVVFEDKLNGGGEEEKWLAIPHPEGYISIVGANQGPDSMRKIVLDNGGQKVPFPDIVSPMLLVNGLLWVASYDLGIFIFDPENGQVRNRLPLTEVSQLALAGETIYGASNNELLALSKSAAILWRNEFFGLKTRGALYGFPFSRVRQGAKRVFLGAPSTLLVFDNKVVMATSEGAMGEFDARKGTLLSVVGNSLGFGRKISHWPGLGILAVTRRGSLALFR